MNELPQMSLPPRVSAPTAGTTPATVAVPEVIHPAIATAERVVVRRLVAGAIDLFLAVAFFSVMVLAFSDEVPAEMCPFLEGASELQGGDVVCDEFLGSGRLMSRGDVTVMLLLVLGGYYGAFVVLRARTGATPGAGVMGLRCVDARGEPLDLGAANRRGAIAAVEWATCGVFALVSLVRMLTAPGHRRFADEVGQCWVVDAAALLGPVDPAAPTAAPPPAVPPPVAAPVPFYPAESGTTVPESFDTSAEAAWWQQ